jgi:hypothetical protein
MHLVQLLSHSCSCGLLHNQLTLPMLVQPYLLKAAWALTKHRTQCVAGVAMLMVLKAAAAALHKLVRVLLELKCKALAMASACLRPHGTDLQGSVHGRTDGNRWSCWISFDYVTFVTQLMLLKGKRTNQVRHKRATVSQRSRPFVMTVELRSNFGQISNSQY